MTNKKRTRTKKLRYNAVFMKETTIRSFINFMRAKFDFNSDDMTTYAGYPGVGTILEYT